jgi:hypothetical protein
MVKQQIYNKWSIKDGQDAADYYEDDHYEEFCNLLFYELLNHIKKIPFENFIQNHLQYNGSVYKTNKANSLFWLYTADRKLIETVTIYSFRFANACHPEFYRTFETKAHHLFESTIQQRHGLDGWYKYIGKDILNRVDRYLNIGKVNQNHHRTKLFINQKEERLDIEFNFKSTNERITITFEPGYPANDILD